MPIRKILLAGILAATCTATTQAADEPAMPAAATPPVFMSAEWAKQACDAWNQDPVLTDKLKEKWVKNHGGKGYKVMQIYRKDCESSPRIEMRVSEQNGKAMCTYGGAATTKPDDLRGEFDYLMWAKTKNWKRMGDGTDGPMKAMSLFRLRFSGPYGEAMGNMGPFANFLLLTGKVPSDRSKCP